MVVCVVGVSVCAGSSGGVGSCAIELVLVVCAVVGSSVAQLTSLVLIPHINTSRMMVWVRRGSRLEGGAVPWTFSGSAGEQWGRGVQGVSLSFWGLQRLTVAQRFSRVSHR